MRRRSPSLRSACGAQSSAGSPGAVTAAISGGTAPGSCGDRCREPRSRSRPPVRSPPARMRFLTAPSCFTSTIPGRCAASSCSFSLSLVVPPAAAADLTVAPRDFSPTAKRLRIQASLPQAQHVGVQLTRADGRVVGWIVPPERRRFLDFRWNGRLGSRRIWDGDYRIRLVDGFRVLATSPLRIDRTPAPAEHPLPQPRQDAVPGRQQAVTTISPNGDNLRESAKIGFTLDEPAQVHFEVTRTLSSPATIYELWANLKPGRTRSPGPALVDRSAHVPDPPEHARQGRQPPHLRRRQCESGPQAQLRGRPRARRRRGLHGRELRRLERGAAARSRPMRPVHAADLPGGRRGHADVTATR